MVMLWLAADFHQVEVTVGQVRTGMCTVRTQNRTKHPDPHPGVTLRVSGVIKAILFNAAAIYGMTPRRLQRCKSCSIEKALLT